MSRTFTSAHFWSATRVGTWIRKKSWFRRFSVFFPSRWMLIANSINHEKKERSLFRSKMPMAVRFQPKWRWASSINRCNTFSRSMPVIRASFTTGPSAGIRCKRGPRSLKRVMRTWLRFRESYWTEKTSVRKRNSMLSRKVISTGDTPTLLPSLMPLVVVFRLAPDDYHRDKLSNYR